MLHINRCIGAGYEICIFFASYILQGVLQLNRARLILTRYFALSFTINVTFENTFTVMSKIIGPPEFFPLDPIVNKLCNIELCGKKMHQLVANMMLSQYLQLQLSLLWRTTTVFAQIEARASIYLESNLDPAYIRDRPLFETGLYCFKQKSN